jgi:Tol biopolymer transport system component
MTRRRTLHLSALLGTQVAAVLMACAVVLLMVSEKAEATFPGKNGRIAYSGYDGNDYEIYTINVNGGDKFQVTNNNTDDYSPSYSPKAKRIAYVGYDRNDAEIYTIKAGGRGKVKLTHNNTDEAAPSYSPDGKRIAYMVSKGNATGHTEIYTIYIGGGGKTKVTTGGQPSYSPNGKKLVYWDYHKTAANPHPDTELYTINVSGGDKSQLTHNNNDEFTPDYSPDGKRIVFAGLAGLERNNAESDIYKINASGVAESNSPTTANTTRIPLTHPTARRSPTRRLKATPSGATSSRSTPSQGVRPN